VSEQIHNVLQRFYVKGIVTNDFGEEFNYKWAEVKK
jgi:hypothetical protein